MTGMEAFGALDLRVGRIMSAEPLAGARKPAYKLTLDLGPLATRVQRPDHRPVHAGALVGRLVVCAVNLGVRRIAGFASEVLVLGLPDEAGRVVLLAVERGVPLGGRVY